MPKNSELTETEQGKILGLRMGGNSIKKISEILKIPKSTVHKNIQCYENAVSLKSAPRSGRPRALKVNDQKILKEIVTKKNRNSAEEIQKDFTRVSGVQVSTKTIRKNLHELGIFSRVAAVKPLLSEQQRENRLK